MPIILEQRFPLGRFHATRWGQSVFEDRFGEWPPSPWRLLRTIAARWIQYSRETGDENAATRDSLLKSLAKAPPSYHLPPASWRPDVVPRQYHRTAIEWTAKGKKDSAYKRPGSSLVYDRFRVLPPNDPIYWCWDSIRLDLKTAQLLDELSRRIKYFGRAESYCHFRTLNSLPEGIATNCTVTVERRKTYQPVLIAKPGGKLDIDSLLAATDSKEVSGMIAPRSAAWYYAKTPDAPQVDSSQRRKKTHSRNVHAIQFGVGGRVYPTVENWVRVTSWFRGRVLKHLARQCGASSFIDLSAKDRLKFSRINGKDDFGKPLTHHEHAYFAFYPNESGLPTRLVCFRDSEFLEAEIQAILAASNYSFAWRGSHDSLSQNTDSGWQIQLVPMPLRTPLPHGIDDTAATRWESATPFVPQGRRHRFRKNGQLRPGETPERLLTKLLKKRELPLFNVTALDTGTHWVNVHETRRERDERRRRTSRNIRQAYYLRIEFESPVTGPICIGHSAHFGLGLFIPKN